MIKSICFVLFIYFIFFSQTEIIPKSESNEITVPDKHIEFLKDDSYLYDLLKTADKLRKENTINEAKTIYIRAINLFNSSVAYNALGEIFLRGEYSSEVNHKKAFLMFSNSMTLKNPDAYHNIALMLKLGIYTEIDSQKSILYDYIASIGGSNQAAMTLGYLHKFGYSVPPSCNTSIKYYKKVAKSVIDKFLKENYISNSPIKLSKAKSVDKLNSKYFKDILIDYLKKISSENTDIEIKYGKLYYHGGVGISPDINKAINLFNKSRIKGNAEGYVYMGYIYLYGKGVKQNNITALDYFKRASDKGNVEAFKTLGVMYLKGQGVKVNFTLAIKYFEIAAQKGNDEAKYWLGKIYRNGIGVSSNYVKSEEYYVSSANKGYIPSIYEVALKLASNRIEFFRTCDMALTLFKLISERGEISKKYNLAYERYLKKDYYHSLMLYVELAEQGFTTAQFNVYWLLTKIKSLKKYEFLLPIRYLSFATDQNDIESTRLLGDYYYHNSFISSDQINKYSLFHYMRAIKLFHLNPIETSSNNSYKNHEYNRYITSASLYHATSKQRDAQSTFNLGYMYEYGVGVVQDFKLAKIYYERSILQDKSSYIPVKLSLFVLYYHSLIYNFYSDENLLLFFENTLLIVSVILFIIIVICKRFDVLGGRIQIRREAVER